MEMKGWKLLHVAVEVEAEVVVVEEEVEEEGGEEEEADDEPRG